MQYNDLGQTGLRISRLSLGAMTFGAGSGIWGEIAGLDRAQATNLVAAAVEQGVNLIDTADAYSQGESETVVGQVLSDLGLDESRLLVATALLLSLAPRLDTNALRDLLLHHGRLADGLTQVDAADAVAALHAGDAAAR